ncbi:hypothetical protein ITP53_25870 [Nonomuraea sp. K274]|uniref:Uncharacterized protein n=1 Tax=Nonomuraea cypriaca TaxID=1187855 RepID=A0A931ADI5_9ACTN|nr:hypothetical protein [Nonomuraea cypriaca]MBF8189099.1 hypothetical protein [Nonomuraea cypriaca]
MTLNTPYASVRHAVLDVLAEAFLSDSVARQLVPSQWLEPTTGRAPGTEHPDAPEVVPSFLARRLLPGNTAGTTELVRRPLVPRFCPPDRGWFAPMMLGAASTSMGDTGMGIV